MAGALVVVLTCTRPASASGQEIDDPGMPVDTAGLGTGPYAAMEMLYERTIFRIDVLRVTLRVGTATEPRLERLVQGRRYSDSEALADAVARTIVRGSRQVLVKTRFLRDIGYRRFLDAFRDNLERAREAGFVTRPELEKIWSQLPEQYAPLRERGVRDGDEMYHRLRGDSLHVAYRATDDRILVNVRLEGADRRRALLGSYFAPGSDFREDLIRSLFGSNP